MALDPDQARHGLTVLTRLAQRSPAGERRLALLLESDPDRLAVPAAEVAIECGEPIAGLLTGLLRAHPLSTETLLALRSRGASGELGLLVHSLLAERLPEDPHVAMDVLTGFARLLLAARRAGEALDAANRAVAIGRPLPPEINETGLLRALDVLSRIHTALGEHDAAGSAITEAVAAAQRRFDGLAEPHLGSALLTQGEQLRRAGQVEEALAAYTRAAEVWREIHRSPDLNPELVMRRLASGGARRGLVTFDPDGTTEAVDAIHIAIGGPSAETYEGPLFGSYRMNAVVGADGEIYVGPRNWSPVATRMALATALRERGRTLLVLARPDQALADLREAVELFADLAGTDLGSYRANLADAEFVLAHCLQWTNQSAEAATAAGRAVDRLAEIAEHGERLLAAHACFAVAEGLGRGRRWIRYFEQLVALARSREQADGGRLGTAVVAELHSLAVTLKNEDLTRAAIPLLALAIDTAGPTQRAISLVSLANAQLRAGDPGAAADSARRAVSAAEALSPPQPVATTSAHHALSRCLAAAGRWDEAREAQYTAVTSVLPAVAADPGRHAVLAVDVLHGYVLAVARREGARVTLPAEVGAAIVDLLDATPPLPERSAVALAEVGFCAVSQAARERDLDRTRHAYRAFRAFAHRHDSPAVRSARAVLGWNVAMCFVDTADLAAAQEAVDDVAALVAEEPDNEEFVVEHGKTASELLAALWNSGAHDAARAVLRAAAGSLRSAPYLVARAQDIGEAPEQFLATLDAIERGT